jgi:hypothetical protein
MIRSDERGTRTIVNNIGSKVRKKERRRKGITKEEG